MNASARRPDLQLELALLAAGVERIAGIDEAGRGALAGPVVAAAVILPLERPGLATELCEVNDSKQLTAAARERVYNSIVGCSLAFAVGSADNHEVDQLGLLPATRLAMSRALTELVPQPEHLLLDYMLLSEHELPQTSQAKADTKSLTVAAASILAKVTRDRWMMARDRDYPGYGFGQHKGYGTAQHRNALKRLGPSPLHRQSYAPVAAAATSKSQE